MAIIDDEDFKRVNEFKWYWACTRKNSCYPVRNLWIDGKMKRIFLHRFIMNPPEGMEVDHINGNTLDNRHENLRICTKRQNSYNRRAYGKTGYRGVTIDKRNKNKKYIAQIGFNKKVHFLGCFDNAKKAAMAYNLKARELFGEFARLNEIN